MSRERSNRGADIYPSTRTRKGFFEFSEDNLFGRGGFVRQQGIMDVMRLFPVVLFDNNVLSMEYFITNIILSNKAIVEQNHCRTKPFSNKTIFEQNHVSNKTTYTVYFSAHHYVL